MLSLFIFLFIVSFSMIGCSDDNTTTPTTTQKANLMVVHASPDAPQVDIYVDGTKVRDTLSFPGNTSYLQINSGTRNIKVNVAGTNTTVIGPVDLSFNANTNTSIFAIDSVAKISPLVVSDDLTAPASGKAHIRFIHLSPNAPGVDVSVTGQPQGTGLFTNRTFNKTITGSESSFTPVDAGTYNLEVRLANTLTVVLPLPGITLTAGKIYTVFASGFVGGSGIQQLNAQIIANN
ncbi:MAG: DUF4397 domain-containing protein [Ignavibacteria bacterium]|nr:DUF4397 domain-containing protein [Ignavibacteria bacterium]